MRAARVWRLRGTLALSLAPAACDTAVPNPPAVTDSAGVRVSISAESTRVFAELSDEPLLDLGGAEAPAPTRFANVRGARLDDAGRLLVADGASNELRIFAPDGSHERTVGGTGDGPGEYRRIRLLGSFGGDSIALWDDWTSELSVLAASGDLVRSTSAWSGEEIQPRAFDVYPDGSVLVLEGQILTASALQDGQLLADTVRLARLRADTGERLPQATAAGVVWVWTGGTQLSLPFTGANAVFAREGERVHVASGPQPEFRIRVFEGGRVVESYGVERPPRPVGDEDVRVVRASMEATVDASVRDRQLATLEHPARPDALPAYAQLVADGGHVWARRYTADPWAEATWDVYAPDRRLAGEVRTPARLFVHQVRGDRLVGVWYDALDVEHVRVYALTRSTPN
jgi:hypothetical protein